MSRKEIIEFFAIVIIGFGVGWLVGMSRSPVVGNLLTSLMATVSIMLLLLSGIKASSDKDKKTTTVIEGEYDHVPETNDFKVVISSSKPKDGPPVEDETIEMANRIPNNKTKITKTTSENFPPRISQLEIQVIPIALFFIGIILGSAVGNLVRESDSLFKKDEKKETPMVTLKEQDPASIIFDYQAVKDILGEDTIKKILTKKIVSELEIRAIDFLPFVADSAIKQNVSFVPQIEKEEIEEEEYVAEQTNDSSSDEDASGKLGFYTSPILLLKCKNFCQFIDEDDPVGARKALLNEFSRGKKLPPELKGSYDHIRFNLKDKETLDTNKARIYEFISKCCNDCNPQK